MIINPREAGVIQMHVLARPGEKRCIEGMYIPSVYTSLRYYINVSFHWRVVKILEEYSLR